MFSCIAISGLGGHAFGSFKERDGSYMWLRDFLPKHFSGARILIYGYNSGLAKSNSFQAISDIASTFRNHIAAIRSSTNVSITLNFKGNSTLMRIMYMKAPRPLVFIAHSLGGIIVKEVRYLFPERC